MRWIPVLSLLAGCSVSHGVRPLAAGEGVITGSLGGPISADMPTPVAFVVPITTVGYAHGVSDTVAVHGAVHPTGLAAFGIFAADAGVTALLLPPSGARPRLMVDADLVLATGKVPGSAASGGTRLFPDVQLVASWDVGKHALYGGIDQFVQPFPTFHYHVSPLVGGVLALGRVDLQLEYMWMAPYQDNRILTAEFIGPFGQGASGVKVGLGVHLGGGS